MIFQPPGPFHLSAQCRQWLANVVFGSVAPPVENPGVRAKDVRRPDVYRRKKAQIAARRGGWPMVLEYSDILCRSPKDCDLDHLVSLDDALRSGAAAWTPAQWAQYQSDEANLVLTDPKVNRVEKRAKDIAHWVPPHHQQAFAISYSVVKLAYGLRFSKEDALRIMDILGASVGAAVGAS